MNRMIRFLEARRNRQGEGGFAMMLSLLVMLIVVSVTLVVAAIVTQQRTPTGLGQKFVRTVNGAQAGMQNTLAQLRAANDGALTGDQIKLPCSDPTAASQYGGGGVSLTVGSPATTISALPGEPITGQVASGANSTQTINYSVSVVYFTTDPTQYENQNNPSWWKNNAIGCPGNILATTPTYAFVQATGTGATVPGLSAADGNRTLQGIYQFETTDSFAVGGRMAEYNSANTGDDVLCMDAMTQEPSAGQKIYMEPCQALGYPEQTWQYRTDLTIYYGGDPSLNLCVQNVSKVAELEPCTSVVNTAAASTYPYSTTKDQQDQEWGFNDNGHFAVANSDGTVNNGSGPSCLDPNGATSGTAASAGAQLIIEDCDGSTTGYTAFNPDPQVGAGKSLVYWNPGSTNPEPQGIPASSQTSQFVNFALFGRCLDVTGQNQNADHLIAYPCKQAPNSCNLTWNQVWAFTTNSSYGVASNTGDTYGEFYTDYASGRSSCAGQATNYCLTAPTTSSGSTYITITPCGTTPTTYQLWDATEMQASYSSSYLMVNKATGLCMAADPSIEPTYGSPTIVATACDGSQVPAGSSAKNSLLLKWNAPPDTPDYGLRGVNETTGS